MLAGVEPVVAKLWANRDMAVEVVTEAGGNRVVVAARYRGREQCETVRIAEMLAAHREGQVRAVLVGEYGIGPPPPGPVEAGTVEDVHG
ncbi:hypothetical protein D3C85_1323050 [compost metagenome]